MKLFKVYAYIRNGRGHAGLKNGEGRMAKGENNSQSVLRQTQDVVSLSLDLLGTLSVSKGSNHTIRDPQCRFLWT